MSEKLSQELVKLATIHSHTMTVSDLMDAAAIVAERDQLQAELAAAKEEAAQAKNALMVSEQYRRKYAEGKYALYAMGGEFTEAAAKHLPWGSEGPLERYEMQVEREHSPLLVDHNKRLVEMLKEAREDSARLDAERAQWKRQGAEEELRRLSAEWGKRWRERRMLAQELVDRADKIKARRESTDGTRA